jgi:hypothetical protein
MVNKGIETLNEKVYPTFMVCWWLLVYFGLVFAIFASFIIAI